MKDNFLGLENNEFATFHFEKGFGACDGVYTGIVKKETKKDDIKLDARKLAATLTHRDYVNQLMGF